MVYYKKQKELGSLSWLAQTSKGFPVYLRMLLSARIEDALTAALSRRDKLICDLLGCGVSIETTAYLVDVSAAYVEEVVNRVGEIIESGRFRPHLEVVSMQGRVAER
jgi:hypothetical protein